MQVEARKVEFVKVHINRRDTLYKILSDMERLIRPAEVAGHDDWYINAWGDIVGITEYNHGSDSNTVLGKADQKTQDVYRAINVIRQNIDVLPMDED